jgi:hypothetical protein
MSGVYNYENMMKLMEEKKNELFKKLLEEEQEEQEEQEMTEYEEHKLDEVRGNFD